LEAIASTAALLITRARADEALRESEERLRLAQQAAEIGTFTWDLLTGASLWSPELEAMHGLPAGGFPGTQEAWEDLIHPEDRDGTLDQVRQSIGSGEPAQGEWRIVWPDGRVRWMQGRWRVFRDETGRPHRMTGVNIDITGRKQAEAALRASREQMRALAARLQAAQEEERRRMARAVHDELGQPLAALGLVLRGIEGDIERMAPGPSVGALTDRIVDASDLADHLGKTVQRLAFDLRPPVLDELGLASALRREAEAFRRRSGVECRVTVSDPDEEPAPGIATALFRIFQEALSNVDRHARARTVDVQFGSVEGAWQLDIVDDGRGIEAGEISRPDAFGLIGMRERAESFGGALTIERRTEGGTAVRVRIPAGREAR
jgi:PAS domain S-box-containing protein